MASNSSPRWRIIFLVGWLVICSLPWISTSHAATRYVDPNGNNAGAGTQSQPWRTIEYAVNQAVSGDRILVNNGTYSPTSTVNFKRNNVSLIANGNSVTIDGSGLSSGSAVVQIYGSDNILVDGFEIRNGPHRGVNLTSDGSTIKNCTIHDNRNEIGIFGWFATNCVIANNDIYANGLSGGIGGTTHGIYFAKGCNNATFEGNYIHDNGEAGLHINGNAPGGSAPFDSDGINRNFIIRNNIFKNNRHVAGNFMNTHASWLYNNIFINNMWDLNSKPDNGTNAENNVIANNTFVLNNRSDAIRLFGPNTGNVPGYCCGNNNWIFNNIVITTDGSKAIRDEGTNNRIGYNFTATYSTNLINSLFENASGGNYQIKPGTTVHDAGTNAFQGKSAPSVDMNGAPRPQGGGWDIGAYEYGGGSSTPPSIPSGFQGAESVAGCVDLDWLANTESNLAGYVLYWGPQSVERGDVTQYANQRDVGLSTTEQTCGLTSGTWYFSIKAYNSAGQYSQYAPEVEVDISILDAEAPTIIGAFPSDGELDVPLESSIFLVISDAVSGVDQSSVSASINGIPAGNISLTGTPSSYGVVVEPDGLLPPNSTVVVDVHARDRAAPPNEGDLVLVFTTSNEAPRPPLLLDVQGTNDGCIDVTWNLNPEPDVIGYTVYYGTTSVGLGQASTYDDSVEVDNISGTSLCGLESGTYYVALKARNGGGLYSEYSSEGSAEVTTQATQAPSPPQRVRTDETLPGCVTVSWKVNREPDIAGYVIYYGDKSVARNKATTYQDSVDVGTDLTHEICLFPPKVRQYFAVRAYNTAGYYSGYSVEKSIKVIGLDTNGPGVLLAYPPNGSSNIALSSKVFVVISDDQTGVNTSSIDVMINGSAPSHVAHSGTANQCVIVCEPQGALPPNRSIDVSVSVADNATPANTGSGGGTFTTENPLPSIPSGLTAAGTEVGCADLAWNANPESNIVGYTIYYGTSSVEAGGAAEYDDSVVVGPVRSRSVCGLADGTYYFTIRARNAAGYASDYAPEATALVTNGSAQGPLPPQGVHASETAPGCVTVGWQPNSEPDVAGYTVYWGPVSVAQGDAGQYGDSVNVGTRLSREVCGFTMSTRYYSVRAYNTSGEYSGYSVERRVDVVGADGEAPVIMVVSPARDAAKAPQNTRIFFTLSDNQTGVDTNSVSVTVSGEPPARVSFVGDPTNYAVICRMASDFAPDTRVDVAVSVEDNASPPNRANDSWSFTTGSASDATAPTFVSHDPPDGAQGVRRDRPIIVRLRDDTGIDISRTQMLVDGVGTTPTATIEQNGDMLLRYQPPTGLSAATHVVRVVAVDLSQNQSELEFSFTVSDGPPSAAGVTPEIVPDGYWKDEPTRPLQVRNIPLGWTVRIFDAAGKEIRSYQNTAGNGTLWEWDFHNNSGRRVAKAIYLVRVLDDGGVVQQSGKFVVQVGP